MTEDLSARVLPAFTPSSVICPVLCFTSTHETFNCVQSFSASVARRPHKVRVLEYSRGQVLCVSTGFGVFVDKPVLPYTNTNLKKLQWPCEVGVQQCQAAFGYRHVLSMTSQEEQFRQKVTEQFISGNLDAPEGSLDAMMQAAVCKVTPRYT